MEKAIKVVLSVTNDIVTDQRLQKVCNSLKSNGCSVKAIGRQRKNSVDATLPFQYKQFKLWFNRGPLFYINYNIRLFFSLLFSKVDILIANDLDTLPANYLVAKIRNVPLIYDSHELFTEVPELIDRPRVQKIWLKIEGFLLPRLKYAYTVGSFIATHYKESYGIHMDVIRNYPIKDPIEQEKTKSNYIIYQGALNVGRGLEELIEAMQYIDNYELYIAGSGDIEQDLRQKVTDFNLERKIRFLGRLKPADLKNYTQNALLGISIEKPMGLNYQYAVPNKIFDYIQTRTPILISNLAEVREILNGYQLGEVLELHEPLKMANQINGMLSSNQYDNWVNECSRAANEFNWESQEAKLIGIVNNALGK